MLRHSLPPTLQTHTCFLGSNLSPGVSYPGSLYLSGNIGGRLNYRISGHRGTVHYLSITSFTGHYGAGQDRLGRLC